MVKQAQSSRRPSNEHAILIVDDDEEARKLCVLVLKERGYRVAAVPSGLHAQQILEHDGVAVIITEHRMQGILGLDLLLLVKRRWPRVRRVLAAKKPSGELVMRARTEADARTLLRPIKPEKLVTVVEEELLAYAG